MWLGLLAVILSGAVGGAVNSVAVKLGVREFPPLIFTTLRFGISTLVFLPIFFSQKGSKLYSADRKVLLAMSLLFALNIMMFSIGLQFTSAIMGQLLYIISPILVAVFAHFLIGEKFSKEKGIGLVIVLFGIGILLYQSSTKHAGLTFGTPLGNLLVLIGVVCTALYIVLSRRLSHSYSATTITFINFLVTAVVVACFAPIELLFRPFVVSKVTHVGIISLGAIVASSIIAYILLYFSIKRTNALIGSMNLYISPFFTALTATVFIGEKITLPLILSGLLILGGVFYTTAFHQVKKIFIPSTVVPEN